MCQLHPRRSVTDVGESYVTRFDNTSHKTCVPAVTVTDIPLRICMRVRLCVVYLPRACI